nr:ABC transporter permease subunit [Corynebacterium sp. UBA5992]
MNWLSENYPLVFSLSVEHLRQCLVPILLGVIISVPIGWVAFRYARTRSALLALTGILYVIPSLALFALLPPLLGISFLSETNLSIALTIYAVATMTQFAADAFGSVSPQTRSAATAVGYSGWGRFWKVELPLAGPVILAGLRVTAMSTVSLGTVGVLIGVSNLGYLFTNGYQRQITAEILSGVLAVALIAVVLDRVLLLAGRALMPWQVVQRKAARA